MCHNQLTWALIWQWWNQQLWLKRAVEVQPVPQASIDSHWKRGETYSSSKAHAARGQPSYQEAGPSTYEARTGTLEHRQPGSWRLAGLRVAYLRWYCFLNDLICNHVAIAESFALPFFPHRSLASMPFLFSVPSVRERNHEVPSSVRDEDSWIDCKVESRGWKNSQCGLSRSSWESLTFRKMLRFAFEVFLWRESNSTNFEAEV